MAIVAKINQRPNVVGSVSQGNQLQVSRITQQATKITQLTDVDLNDVVDGSFLVYNSDRRVFVTTSSISGAAF